MVLLYLYRHSQFHQGTDATWLGGVALRRGDQSVGKERCPLLVGVV